MDNGVLKKKKNIIPNYFFMKREFNIVLIILFSGFLMSMITPNFLRLTNLQSLVIGLSLDVIMAVGMTLVIIAGGVDLSVGSLYGLTAIVAGQLHVIFRIPMFYCVIISLLLAVIVGFLTGMLVAKLKIPYLIATLVTMVVARGFTDAMSGGFFISGFPKRFNFIGQGFISIFPICFLIMTIIVLIFSYLLKNTKYFQEFYFVGGNRTAATLSGINADRIEITTYIISSTLAGVAGIIMASRLGMASPNFGVGAEMRVIAGCVIGGTSLGGGTGNILGSVFGVTLLALVTNALILLNVSVYWQEVAYGLALLTAVVIDAIRSRKQ